MYGHCWKLRSLRCRPFLCRRRRRAGRMHVHAGVCVHINNIERVRNNDRVVCDLHGRELVFWCRDTARRLRV